MKFKFAKNLDFQLKAINAVVGVFDTGKNIVQTEKPFELQSFSKIIKNELEVEPIRILKNLQSIQRQNNIKPAVENLDSIDFSIEMETGTGKTYVYLRTILELNQKYGLKKFIILVPSVAIREGVLKTIEQTKGHFQELYNYNIEHACFAYDSDKLSKVREFAQSLDIKIMIMTVQSFAGNERLVMRQTPDRFGGERPIDLIAETCPVVIMDEPQNMESDLAKVAIADLHPLFKLRYSATHKEIHNLLYRLTPVDAYRKGLVKKISVFGVKDDDPSVLTFKVKEIITKKNEAPKAKVILEVKNAEREFIKKEVLIKAGDDLEKKTKNPAYVNLDIRDVNAMQNRVELSDGSFHEHEGEPKNKEAVFRTQIHETIKAHFDKQEELGETIKVLSLFFIDRVANYVNKDGLIRAIFCEEFTKLQKNYLKFRDVDVNAVHSGYFASRKERGQITFQDTHGDSKIDKEAYDLIMKDKEKLLSFSEPVSFIFSHSALKEGWDNPNIFQICTLKETQSFMKKRQEIGRGLRLPVDVDGDRIYDPQINVLTVVANESYQEYISQLQTEFTEAGYLEQIETTDAKEKPVMVKTTKNLDTEDFKKLWAKINKRTRYNLAVRSEALIESAITKINELEVRNLVVTVDKVSVYFDGNGRIQTSYSNQSTGERLKKDIIIQNVVDRIARETGLTKMTLITILLRVENLGLLFENPEEYTRSVIVIIQCSLNDLLINDGLKYLPTGDVWEIKLLFGEFEAMQSKTIPSDRSVFDRVAYDSKGEKEFAEHLENSSNVKVYTKLPRGFMIDTPLGVYIPDWAIVWKTGKGDKLYLVRETKFEYTNLHEQLPLVEQQKILCGKKHFDSIGFNNFNLAEDKDLRDLI